MRINKPSGNTINNKPGNHQVMADLLRVLSADAVQKAGSGHPGMPMGMAEIAYVLWKFYLKHNPKNPDWVNRDRFILSNGHGSMLHYALLHLTGYDLPIDELKQFRKLGSATPGHPEVGITPGVETTTGPLGQGLANGVGMALAEKLLANEFNRPGFPIIDHNTYVFLGDGCLMEGISHEVCSLAGVWGLEKLICFYDDNNISIDGEVGPWFNENVASRFKSYGWNVLGPIDGHDVFAIKNAIDDALSNEQKLFDGGPTIIICKTIIGKGEPEREGTAKAHGEPLGTDGIQRMRRELNWEFLPFEVPEDHKKEWDCSDYGHALEGGWQNLLENYKRSYPTLADSLETRLGKNVINPEELNNVVMDFCLSFAKNPLSLATRKASQNFLNKLGPRFNGLLGGSADLSGSNLTMWDGSVPVRKSETGAIRGNYLNFGVREFGMAAICSGISLHKGFLPYCGTFLVFSDYMRNAIRLAALMGQKIVFVFTHDSIGLGEDGPTHQPVEQAASLRLIPNLHVWRPSDSAEVAFSWKAALLQDGPTAILLSRQKLPSFRRNNSALRNISKGGYILIDEKQPDVILIGTGSEVKLAVSAGEELKNKHGIKSRIVSMPSTTIFDQQSRDYKEKVVPNHVPKMIIEAGVTDHWWKYNPDVVLGIDKFGESAPEEDVFEAFGISSRTIVDSVLCLLGNDRNNLRG